jgi:NADPH:quinone reductase-like Zn-dependent oxidoreductase
MKYRRVIITKHGGPEVLKIIENELPEPKPGEVRIQVKAAGVAWADIMMRTGLYPGKLPAPPFTPGYDIAGIVDKLGDRESSIPLGQPVTAITKLGGYSEYICLPLKNIIIVPSGLDYSSVTCLPLNYITAYQMLHRFANVKSGERILIHGAAGGVGTALMQLGTLADLQIYGTASPKKLKTVKNLGGTPIDYTSVDFVEFIKIHANNGVDAVFDPIGGNHLFRSYNTLREGGRLIAYGERSIVGDGFYNETEAFEQEKLMDHLKDNPNDISIQWYEVYDHFIEKPHWFQEDMAKLLELLAQKRIKPVIAKELPLEQSPLAHKLLEDSAIEGKIVLLCSL